MKLYLGMVIVSQLYRISSSNCLCENQHRLWKIVKDRVNNQDRLRAKFSCG